MHRQAISTSILSILVLATVFVASGKMFAQGTTTSSQMSTKILTQKELAFHDAMRKLWEDHIIWTRVFIISAAADLPDKAAATDRLLKNQVDIGDAIKPYYGTAAGDKLTTLLKEHITTAAEVVTAAKAGDKPKQDDATKRWFCERRPDCSFLK